MFTLHGSTAAIIKVHWHVWTRSHTQRLPSNDTSGINIEQMEKTHQSRAEILKLSWGHDRIMQHGCNETATHRHVYYTTMYLENNFSKKECCCSSLTKKKKTIWKKTWHSACEKRGHGNLIQSSGAGQEWDWFDCLFLLSRENSSHQQTVQRLNTLTFSWLNNNIGR